MANNLSEKKNILLAGASVRALAQSCLRAGLVPWCMDCFADYDLLKQCEVVCVRDGYPASILESLKNSPLGPLLYSGGLENNPLLLEKFQLLRPLAGIHGATLKKLRRVSEWSTHLERKGIRVPRLHNTHATILSKGQWLAKPIQSGAGKGIFFATVPPGPGYILQEFIQGESRSASFCFHEHHWQLLGATIQIPPKPWLHSTGFQYSGNIGPVGTDTQERLDLETIAQTLLEFAQPRGLVNLDYILTEGRAIPLEFNPRYSASMELLELALGRSLITDHLVATGWGQLCTQPTPCHEPVQQLLGKAIFYAGESCQFPAHLPEFQSPTDLWTPPKFADIPESGQEISSGQPVLTLFAEGSSPKAVLSQLEGQSGKIKLFLAKEGFIP